MLKTIISLLFLLNFTSLSWADLDSLTFQYNQFLKNKISKKEMIKLLNSELYLPYPIKDIELVESEDKVNIHWYLEVDKESSAIKLAKSVYSKPITSKRLTRSLNALQSYRKIDRAIASIPQIEQNLAKRDFDNKKPTINAGLQFGQVAIRNEDKKLNFNLLKATGSYRVKWGDGYSLALSTSVVRFLDIVYSEGANSKSFENNLYEFGLDFNKSFGKLSLGGNISSLNYVILSDETVTDFIFSPQRIFRASPRASYQLSDDTSITGSLGLITGSGLTGFDYSAGIAYHFGNKKEYLVSPSFYSSIINIADGGTDQSSAMTFSFAINMD